MKRFSPVMFALLLLFTGCDKEALLNARIAGSYDAFVKGQVDFWFNQLAVNYTDNDELDAYCSFDGDGDPVEIRLQIEKKNRKKIDLIIPDQEYEDDDRISGSGVIINNHIELYYIIGNNNLSRSYVLSGNR